MAQSNEITEAIPVYKNAPLGEGKKNDFPSILEFTGSGIFPNTGAYEDLVILEVVNPISFPFNVIGRIRWYTLTLPTIGDVETNIQGYQDTIQDGF